MPPTKPPPTCVVDKSLADHRIKRYQTFKKLAMNECIKPKIEIDMIEYPIDVFRDMFEFIIKADNNFTGLRIYLASFKSSILDPGHIPTGMLDKLTLLFVPTIDVKRIKTTDDLGNIMAIVDGALINFTQPGYCWIWQEQSRKMGQTFPKESWKTK